MADSDYQKYCKYKLKYNKLKKSQNGGSHMSDMQFLNGLFNETDTYHYQEGGHISEDAFLNNLFQDISDAPMQMGGHNSEEAFLNNLFQENNDMDGGFMDNIWDWLTMKKETKTTEDIANDTITVAEHEEEVAEKAIENADNVIEEKGGEYEQYNFDNMAQVQSEEEPHPQQGGLFNICSWFNKEKVQVEEVASKATEKVKETGSKVENYIKHKTTSQVPTEQPQ